MKNLRWAVLNRINRIASNDWFEDALVVIAGVTLAGIIVLVGGLLLGAMP